MSALSRRREDLGAGVGLRAAHYERFLNSDPRPQVAWLEVHAENHFHTGSIRHRMLCEIAERYPISVHGVALSLGSPDGIDAEHLARLAELVTEVDACLVSEHLAWSRLDGTHYNDLLPLPLTDESLDVVAANVDRVQRVLGRSILIENPAGYLQMPQSTLTEPEFLAALVERTGCGLLVDANNLFVSAVNLGSDPLAWLAGIPRSAIGEIHLAGHESSAAAARPFLIDTHGAGICAEVWALYTKLLQRCGPQPTLIERDSNIPALEVLLDEVARADGILGSFRP